ncbi:hypothetical protein DA102_035555 [Sinorhizobium meliloti]|nr:hypothetical protein DA102_035555 [Sinorhizobium meliloti]
MKLLRSIHPWVKTNMTRTRGWCQRGQPLFARIPPTPICWNEPLLSFPGHRRSPGRSSPGTRAAVAKSLSHPEHFRERVSA